MAPAYKLTYFNGRGLAEPIRYLFKYGNIEFEDVRVERENWPKLKESIEFGVLPTLEHNGLVIGQSTAIARYVAKLVKLAGNNELEDLQIDAIVDTFIDLRLKLRAIFGEEDADKKKELLEKAKAETVPYYLSRFDAVIKKNNGFVALGRLTWGDFYFAALIPIFKFLLGEDTDVVKDYPNLADLVKKVNEIPQIKEWIEKRPVTAF